MRVGFVGGTASETLDALCEGGPWKREGGGSRCEFVGFLESSMVGRVQGSRVPRVAVVHTGSNQV